MSYYYYENDFALVDTQKASWGLLGVPAPHGENCFINAFNFPNSPKRSVSNYPGFTDGETEARRN